MTIIIGLPQESQENLNVLLIFCLLCHQFPSFLDQLLLSAKLHFASPRLVSIMVKIWESAEVWKTLVFGRSWWGRHKGGLVMTTWLGINTWGLDFSGSCLNFFRSWQNSWAPSSGNALEYGRSRVYINSNISGLEFSFVIRNLLIKNY